MVCENVEFNVELAKEYFQWRALALWFNASDFVTGEMIS
jgi:hypothetical protein